MPRIVSVSNSKRRRAATAGFKFLLLGAVHLPSIAAAQENVSASDTAAARGLAVEGLKLAEKGDCDLAIDRLSRAEKIRHSPVVLGRLGECLIEVGKIVEGTEAVRQVLRETVAEDAAPGVTRARERAQRTLDAATPRIVNLTISLVGPLDFARVTIDGQVVPHEILGMARPTNPGEHDLSVTAPGYLDDAKHVNLQSGAQTVTLTLRRAVSDARMGDSPPGRTREARDFGAGALDVASAQRRSTESIRRPLTGPNYTGSYLFWAAGAAAVLVGGAFGLAALSDKRDLDRQCSARLCPTSARESLDVANRDANLSTILIGTGVAALGVGVVLYVTARPGDATDQLTTGHRPRGLRGLEGVQIRATF